MTALHRHPRRVRRARSRLLALGVVAAVGAATHAGSAHARGRDPMPVWAPATTLDLARMTIRATDLPGQGYGTEDGSVYAGIDGTTEYSAAIGLPNPADPTKLARKISSAVELFADPAAAQADLDEWRSDLSGTADGPEIVVAGSDSSPRQVVDGAPIVGDDSLTTTFTGSVNDGATARVIEITMRVDRIVASVAISDFSGPSPSIDELDLFATEVVRRAREGLANNSVGLFHRMVRFDDDDLWTTSGAETYTVVDGTFVPFVGTAPGDIAATAAHFTSAGVADAYTYQGALESTASGTTTWHSAWIYTFGDEATAAAYLDLGAAYTMADVPGSTRSTPPGVTGAATAVSYTAAEDPSSSGHRVWVQSGSNVVSVDLERSGGLPIEAVVEVANLQVACAQSPEVCPARPAPAALGAP